MSYGFAKGLKRLASSRALASPTIAVRVSRCVNHSRLCAAIAVDMLPELEAEAAKRMTTGVNQYTTDRSPRPDPGEGSPSTKETRRPDPGDGFTDDRDIGAELLTSVTEMKEGQIGRTHTPALTAGRASAQAAAIVGVGHTIVDSAKAVKKEAPKLFESVRTGSSI